jgi:dienelactone hydrolase
MNTMHADTPETISHPPIPQEAFDWYDEYAHGIIDRRTFMGRLSTLAAAGFSMSLLLSTLMPDYAHAEQVSFNDPDIKARYVVFPSPGGHGEGRALQSSMDKTKIEQDFVAAAKFLKAHELSNGKLGAVGFCFGGYIVNMLAAVVPDTLNAGVPFYGTPAAKEVRKNIKAPLMIQLAELDTRVNDTWPEYEADLKAAKVNYTMHMYPKCNHGFHNDSTGRYDEKNAQLAWERTVAFFKQHLA